MINRYCERRLRNIPFNRVCSAKSIVVHWESSIMQTAYSFSSLYTKIAHLKSPASQRHNGAHRNVSRELIYIIITQQCYTFDSLVHVSTTNNLLILQLQFI